jgi:hypothetical protein
MGEAEGVRLWGSFVDTAASAAFCVPVCARSCGYPIAHYHTRQKIYNFQSSLYPKLHGVVGLCCLKVVSYGVS